MSKLEGNTATLALSNTHSLTISVDDGGEKVYYQYNGGNDNRIYEAEIEYFEDAENRTGCANEDNGFIQPAFRNAHGTIYFIGEFLRDNY